MSNMSDQTKSELLVHSVVAGTTGSVTPVQISQTISVPEASGAIVKSTTGSTSRSKPQACKICGKVLSSASSYYVHMKLHSGTKPYRCGVSLKSHQSRLR